MKVNYQVHIDEKNRQVIAVCRYAGRKVRAVAKCAPEDEFNIEIGTKLAIARCEWKVARIKWQNASVKYLNAAKAADEAQKHFDKMKQYFIDSVDQLDEVGMDIQNIITELNK